MNNNSIVGIDVLDPNVNYWFVRTDGGENFKTFYENGFIAIGWNEITIKDLEKPEGEVKAKIAREYGFDLSTKKGKTKTTDVYNKILRFRDLKKDDVIVLPSQNSDVLAFGIVSDERIYSKVGLECDYLKRRNVKWIERRNFESLDTTFYKIRKSRHSISQVTEYADHIDSVMYSVYKKSDSSHFVVRVRQRSDINWKDLATLLLDMHNMLQYINKEMGYNEDIESGTIQISIQSPGLFNLKQKGNSLILLAALLGASSCSQVKDKMPAVEKKKVENIQTQKAPEIDSISATLRGFHANL